MTKKIKPYTAQDIRAVVRLWESKTTDEIAAELGRSKQSVGYIANAIRKAGHRLPRKHKIGSLQNLIKETLGIK